MKAYHLVYIIIGLIVFGTIIALNDHDLRYSQQLNIQILSKIPTISHDFD
jgi:hypothetical protein